MLLLVGLGNPGSQYARNRHNIGFMAADAIHVRHGFSPWRHRFQAATSEARLGDRKCLLMKPQTFMNNSGTAVAQAARFYKIAPHDIVVIHDEVDLPPGKTRMKTGGGAAGHNGLKSISAAVGGDYRRLRLGIGHPGRREAAPHYVLHDFAKADRAWIDPLIDAIADNTALLAANDDATFANRLHIALNPSERAPRR
ncbi:MAG: aminoacyl-tRNA hydrolase, partial [Alphaproteobacteria bacterium]